MRDLLAAGLLLVVGGIGLVCYGHHLRHQEHPEILIGQAWSHDPDKDPFCLDAKVVEAVKDGWIFWNNPTTRINGDIMICTFEGDCTSKADGVSSIGYWYRYMHRAPKCDEVNK